MAITWQAEKSAPDPFAASVGDSLVFHVHYGTSDAVSDEDIKHDLAEVVAKALPHAKKATGERAVNLLFLWDALYCHLTIVCSDKTMMEDSSHVTKCSILSLEAKVYDIPPEDDEQFERELDAISGKIQVALTDILKNTDPNELPVDMPMLFSSEQRSSVSDEVFRENTVQLM